MSRGITYVAWGKCIPEAEKSAVSAKEHGLRSSLITNEDYKGSFFDKIIHHPNELSQGFNIVSTYELSPWDETLWLDTDTLILDDLTFAFDMAAIHGIAIVIAPHSSLRGRGIEGIPEEAPEYNCGAVWVNSNHPAIVDFGKKWKNEAEGYNGGGWWTDQSSLSYMLYKYKINPYVLPSNWNFRAYMNREFSKGEFHTSHGFGPIKIWHSRTPVPKNFDAESDWFWELRDPWWYRVRLENYLRGMHRWASRLGRRLKLS